MTGSAKPRKLIVEQGGRTFVTLNSRPPAREDASDGPAAPLVEQPSAVEPNGEILPRGPDASPNPNDQADLRNLPVALPVPAGNIATGVTEPLYDAEVDGFDYTPLTLRQPR